MGAGLEKSARRVDYLTGAEEGDEILLETCDVTGTQSDAFSNGGSRSYATLVPWDVPFRLVITSLIIIGVTVALVFVPELYEYHHIPTGILIGAVVGGIAAGALSVLSQIPRRVTRKADSLIIEFMLHSHTVPLGDVLELVVLRDGRQFWQLLRRWKVFPSGGKLRLFFGAPSNAGSLCVLLTRRLFWSFCFCLQDPVQFLLDNQRPLNTEVTYRATLKCVMRREEDLSSERIGTVPRGARIKVLEQRGRRVLVKLEGTETVGWMSYLTPQGVALLTKQSVKGEKATAGTIGASELSRTDTCLMELGRVGNGCE
jgi:hypothetical protein